MGCGSSHGALEEQEVTMEDQTREGQMGITDDQVTEQRRRRRMQQKRVPWNYPNQSDEDRLMSNGENGDAIHSFNHGDSDSDSDTIKAYSGTSSEDDDLFDETELRKRARRHIERLNLPQDSARSGSTISKGEIDNNNKENVIVHRNAVDILNEKKIQNKNTKLEAIEKMEGANASFMRRTNSLKASCSFKSEDTQDLDDDDSSENGSENFRPLLPNPWDSRKLKSSSSQKSVLSQSGVGLKLKSPTGRKNKLTPENAARSAYAAGAFLQWETTKDSIGPLDHVTDVTFMDEHLLLVSQDSDTKVGIQIYDTNQAGNPTNVLGGAWIKASRGVCVNWMEGNAIAVTDPGTKSVRFFSTIGDGIGSWKKDMFKMPGGITVNSEGNYIVSDVQGKDKAIHVVSPEGKVIRRFGIGFFDWPWYVAVDSQDRIIVSEQSSSSIIVFDKNGKVINNFARQGKSDGKLNFPNGVTVDFMDNIVVADTNNHRISLFSSDGVFIKNILSHLSYKPISMAFNDSGNLAVVSDSSLHFYQTYQQKAFLL